MRIVILADELSYRELIPGETLHTITRVNALNEFENMQSDAFIDLQFDGHASRIVFLKKLSATVLINSVPFTIKEMGAGFTRFNGWSTFLNKPIVDAFCQDEMKEKASDVFNAINKKLEWVQDSPGFITPRILSMIINEAFYALGEGVSSKNEIDIAMKLGTGYPFGPFEWSERIGLKNVHDVMAQLAKSNLKYSPAPALINEINQWS